MNTLRLLICLTTTLTLESSTYLSNCAFAQLIGCEALRHDVVDERKRDAAVRPHRHVVRQILLAPDDDREHIFWADNVAGWKLHAGRHRGSGRDSRRRRRRRRRGRRRDLLLLLGAGRDRHGERDRDSAPNTEFHWRYSLKGSWQSCFRRKFRKRL
jgi:hypothetical protein